jgi:hypothetical protein
MRRVILASLLTVAIAGCGSSSVPSEISIPVGGSVAPGGSAAPGASATADANQASTPKPSPKPTTEPTPKPTPKPIAACLASALKAKVTGWNGAAGSQIAAVTLTNKSTKTCTMRGTPEVELVDTHGGILIDSQTGGANGLPHIASGAPTFKVAPNGKIKTQVSARNYCGGTPALPTTVAFVLPSGAGRLVAAPGPGGSVPPCNKTPGSLGSIDMNGWKQ